MLMYITSEMSWMLRKEKYNNISKEDYIKYLENLENLLKEKIFQSITAKDSINT